MFGWKVSAGDIHYIFFLHYISASGEATSFLSFLLGGNSFVDLVTRRAVVYVGLEGQS